MAGSYIWILWFWMVTTNGSSTDLLVSMDGGIDETINTMAWRGMYKVIGETNAFIANIADSPLESADKLPMEAAARFCVHWLIIIWQLPMEMYL